jgi:hypothetical protein
MIYLCPFCGRKVSRAIKDGITTCNNCNRVFDSSSYHKVLSAAWLARRDNLSDVECLKAAYELTDCEAKIIKKYVIDEGNSHDDLIRVLDHKTCIDRD